MKISDIVKEKFSELRTIIKEKNGYYYQIKCEIEQNEQYYLVHLYIHDWVMGTMFHETRREIYLDGTEVQELIKVLYEEDAIVTVAAPATHYDDSNVSIIGVQSEIVFDDATRYSDMIDRANSEALLKDPMVNRDITGAGKEFKYWKFVTLQELCQIPNFRIAFLKCAVLLENWSNDDITEENMDVYMEQRILNRIENVDKFLVLPNHFSDTYLVKSQRENVKANKKQYQTN